VDWKDTSVLTSLIQPWLTSTRCAEFNLPRVLFVGIHERLGVTAKRGKTRLLYHILGVVAINKDNPDELMQAACLIYRRDRMCIEAEVVRF
jgi:hypothetical protein